MRILHVIPSLAGSSGGPAQAVTQLCVELRNQGVEVAIATTCVDSGRNSNSVATYCFSRQFSPFLPSDFAFSYGLKYWLKQHTKEFDLLHIHCLFTFPSAVACYYAHKYKVPYILRPAGMLSSVCLKKSALKKKLYIFFLEERNLRNAAALHFTSEEEMFEAGRFKLNNQRILLPPGLNLEKFRDIESLKGLFRNQYSQAKDKKIILFLSRIDPKKGLDILIPALKILSGKRDDFVFILAGSGRKNYEHWVRRALAKAGLIKSSMFTGFLQGRMKFALLAEADIFVLSSYDENFGIAVVEAMASSLPVIISNRVNIHKLIEDYQAGVITELDSGQIALALDRLLSDDNLRRQMGVNGRKLAGDNFDLKEIASQMREVYSRLIRKGMGSVI